MFFSPITERSWRIRFLYASLYAALTLGAITILMPLLVMIAGSMDPTSGHKGFRLFPGYFFSDSSLWSSYIQSKYNQSPSAFRNFWNEPSAEIEELQSPAPPDSGRLALWDEFVAGIPEDDLVWVAGFMGNDRMPQQNRLAFSRWILARFEGDLARLNAALGTQFPTKSTIVPPNIGLAGALLLRTPLVEAYIDFTREVLPPAQRIPLNASGYYRSTFLPRVFGPDIQSFNKKYGTSFSSYSEVPFTSTVPTTGADEWFQFASKIIRPNFIELTEAGAARQKSSALPVADFIRLKSQPGDLRIRTIDMAYAEFALARGAAQLDIPQKDIDARDFLARKGELKRLFASQNYVVVLEEVLVQGRAIANTLILVTLCIAGTLIVNPLAAYALSRFRPRLTYQVLLFCLVTVALPAEVTMIPIFLQLKTFGLLNSFGALVIPTLANGFSIFLLKGFFDSLPKELYEAAEIDGASEWTMFWQLTMTLSRPILAVLALGAFVGAYGTFMYALILCPDPQMWTIMVYLFQLMQIVDTPVLYAALIISAIPTTLVFIFCQNIIMRGIVVPSEK